MPASRSKLIAMGFVYSRTIRFQDTDAAGVVYFAAALAICHEAYEASLAAAGVDLGSFFSRCFRDPSSEQAIAVPIVHAEIDFWQPMICGEQYQIELTPTRVAASQFQIRYRLSRQDQPHRPSSQATTMHVCIDPEQRSRVSLPLCLEHWLEMHSKS